MPRQLPPHADDSNIARWPIMPSIYRPDFSVPIRAPMKPIIRCRDCDIHAALNISQRYLEGAEEEMGISAAQARAKKLSYRRATIGPKFHAFTLMPMIISRR